MKTGLTKRQKTTCIYFDEASKTVEIQTHNTALKKRLAKYAAAYHLGAPHAKINLFLQV